MLVEGPVGFEPTTRGLKGRCSNQAELWALVATYARASFYWSVKALA
jgi:hypothetical protein